MSSITTRAGKGSALTHNEVDANFTNLNTDKAELTGANNFTNATGQTFRRAATQDGVLIRGRAGGTSSYRTEITPTTLTANRTITLPNSDGTVVTTGDSGTVTSTMIADGTIVNADINASAAIAHSKLASVTAGSVLLGNSGNVATSTALTGDVTVNSSGVTAIGSGVIVDNDISASAEIAVSKLADGTARQLLQTDAAGTGVEWTSNVDIPGTLDVTGTATFDGDVQLNPAFGNYAYLFINGPSGNSAIFSYGEGLYIQPENIHGNDTLTVDSDCVRFVTSGGYVAFQTYSNFLARAFGTVTTKNTTATLLAFEMYSGIVTSTAASAVSLTLPNATTMDTDMNTAAGGTYVFNSCFEWSVINTGGTNSVTLVASTNHAIVGSAIITAGNSGRFLTVKDGNPSYTTYRISS